MDEFRFFALGESFDVGAFLAKCPLEPSYVWRKGEKKRYSCIGTPYPTSGLEFRIGNRDKYSFYDQQGLAIAFIETHRDVLSELSAFPGVTHSTLGLEYPVRLEENFLGFSISASTRLMRLLIEVGFGLTHYVAIERAIEADGVKPFNVG